MYREWRFRRKRVKFNSKVPPIRDFLKYLFSNEYRVIKAEIENNNRWKDWRKLDFNEIFVV